MLAHAGAAVDVPLMTSERTSDSSRSIRSCISFGDFLLLLPMIALLQLLVAAYAQEVVWSRLMQLSHGAPRLHFNLRQTMSVDT